MIFGRESRCILTCEAPPSERLLLYLPAPATPAAHSGLYGAMAQFSLGLGLAENIVASAKAYCALADPQDSGNSCESCFLGLEPAT